MSTKRKPKHSHQKIKMNTHNGRINVNNDYMKRWSNQGNAISNEMSLLFIRQAKIRKADKAKCWQEDGEIGSTGHTKSPNLVVFIKLHATIHSKHRSRKFSHRTTGEQEHGYTSHCLWQWGAEGNVGGPLLREQVIYRQQMAVIHKEQDVYTEISSSNSP